MNDSELRLTPTHAAEDFQGTVIGIQTTLFAWVCLALLASLALFAWLFYAQGRDFTSAMGWSALPVIGMVAYLRFCHMGKPPGHSIEVLSSLLTGGHSAPPNQFPPHTSSAAGPFPDGYLADGLLVFDGPAGCHVAMGFALDLPDLQTASFGERNRAQDLVATLIRQLPEDWTLQVQTFQDSSDGPRLLAYQQDTERCSNPTARRLRNINFVTNWHRLEQGELRRRRVVLFVGRRLAPASAPRARDAAEQYYNTRLAEARSSLQGWQHTLNEVMIGLGGRCTPLTDTDLARLWAGTLNPSFGQRLDFDPAAGYDLQRSLLDNVWHSELRGQGRQGFVLDGWPHLAFSLKRLPSETYFTILQRLTELPFGDFTVTTHVRRLDKERVLKRTQAALDRIHQQLKQKPNERLSVAAGQFQEKVRRLATGEVVPLEFELVVIVRARTAEELSMRAASIKSAFPAMNGAQYYEATLAASARNLFALTLPGWMGSRHRGFVHYGEDRYVADLLPLAATFAGHPGPVQALFPGRESNLVNVVTFLGEGEAATPQNFIIIGAPGTGKSLAFNKLLFESELGYGFTAIVEEGLSQAPYTRSFGIQPIVFRLDGTQTINPFGTQGLPLFSFARASLTAIVARMVGLPADEDKARRQSALIARHISQICDDHAREQLRQWPQERRAALIRHALALDRWAAEHGESDTEAFLGFREWQQTEPAAAAACIAHFTDVELLEFESTHTRQIYDLLFAHLRPDEHLTLSALREYFELAQEDEEECRWLSTLLSPWCRGGGNCGVLFDGVSNVALNGPVVHFELGLIPEAAKEIKAVVGFLVINSLRQHILSLPRLMWKRIIIEEVSRFLEVPGAETILRELSEQFRKHRSQISMIAQSYSRIADTSIRVALFGNTRAWMIFNTGDRRDIERLGQDLGLSRVAQEAILRFPRPDQQTGAKYSEFLYWHSDARQPICGIVRYTLLPFELPATESPAPSSHAH